MLTLGEKSILAIGMVSAGLFIFDCLGSLTVSIAKYRHGECGRLSRREMVSGFEGDWICDLHGVLPSFFYVSQPRLDARARGTRGTGDTTLHRGVRR